MNRKTVFRSPIFFATIIIAIMVLSSLTQVNAVGYYEYNLPSSRTDDFIQNENLVHRSGKFLSVSYNVTDKSFTVEIFLSDGTYFGSVSRDSDDANISPTRTRLKLIDLDDDEFLVVEGTSMTSGTSGRLTIVRYNINTLVSSWNGYEYLKWESQQQGNIGLSGIDYGWYENKIYLFILHTHESQTNTHRLCAFEYNPSTNAYDTKTRIAPPTPTASSTYQGFLNCYVYTASPNLMFVTVATEPELTKPLFYIYDANADTWEFQCQYPSIDHYSNSEKFQWLESGYRVSGDYIYIHHNWINTRLNYANSPVIRIVQQRIVYNYTVQASNITAQNYRSVTISPLNRDASALDEHYVLGYVGDDNASELHCYYEIQTYDSGEDEWFGELWECKVTVTDWFNYGIGTMSVNYNRVSDEVIYSYDWSAPARDNSVYNDNWKDWSTQWQTTEKYANNNIRVYYGLIPIVRVFDITFTMTPDETPKIVNKNYRFSFSATSNGEGLVINFVGYMDGVQRFSGQTLSNGVMRVGSASEVIILFGTEGVHTITIELRELGTAELLYTETYSDVWSTTGLPDEADDTILLPMAISMFATLVPILFIVFVPIFSLGELAGKIGILAGLVLGVTVGALSGLLPMFSVFLLILVVVLAFVFLIRGGRF